MATITVKNKEKQVVSADYDLPEDLNGLTKRFTADVVAKQARSSMVVSLQGFIRGLSNSGKSAKEIQAAVNDWMPSSRQPGKSRAEKAQELFGQLSDEEKAAFLAQAGG